MTNKEIYKILEQAERDFKLLPSEKLHNECGLCNYFNMHGICPTDRKYILGDKYSNVYEFANGVSQLELKQIINEELSPLFYERSNWCSIRKLDFIHGGLK